MAYFVIIIVLKKIPKNIKFITENFPRFYDKLNVHLIINVIKRNLFVQTFKYLSSDIIFLIFSTDEIILKYLIYMYIYVCVYIIRIQQYYLLNMAYGVKEKKLEEGERAVDSIFYVTHGRKRQRD